MATTTKLYNISFFRTLVWCLVLALSVGFVSCSSTEEVAAKERPSSSGAEKEFKQHFFDGQREKISGNADAAIGNFKKCIELIPEESAPYYELARIYQQLERYELAIAQVEKALEREPKNVWYRGMYAQLSAVVGNYSNAISAYKKLIEEHPHDYNYYFELAGTHIMKEDYDSAIAVFDELESKLGLSDEVTMQKQMLYLEMGKVDRAIEEVKKLVEANPEEVRFLGVLAELYDKNGQPDKAVETYQRLSDIDPDNGMLHLSLSEFYRNAGDDAKAFDELVLAFKSPEIPIDKKINVLLNYYTETENNKELLSQAYTLCEILVEQHPDDAKSFSIYGDYLYRDERLKEARDQFEKAAKIDKSRYVIWNQILILDSQLEDVDRMITTSEKALELFPTMPSFYLFNGVAHLQKKNYEKAIESLEAGVDLVVENFGQLAQFYGSLGDAYHAIGNHESSDEAYEMSLSVQENNAYVLNNYSYYLSERNEELDKALEMAKKANELQPGEATFQDTYAWVLYKLSRYEEAREWLEKALNNGGVNDGTVLEHYGDVLYRLNRKEEALDYWQQAKALGGTSDQIDQKISDKKLNE